MLLFYSLLGVQSAEQLTQSEPAVIKPGNSHTLTCKASGFTFSNYWYYMHWIRQFSDGKLQWLCYISSGGSTGYNDAVKGRFTTTRDNNNNKLTLKTDNMKIEDTAMYYCARETH
ncbi:unnamed protein product [Staurois parvus]|uniref:Ig-like domain-containing protein n=1 Tax=Staurois parvus TaxID=386267 RepID=A0ABN9HBN4_9NEOB|nr:unnamed protein product [Staurois parvus]